MMLWPVVAVTCLGCQHIVMAEYGSRSAHGDTAAGREQHRGVDFRMHDVGDPVLAAAEGVVLDAVTDGRTGVTVVIRHPAFDRVTKYKHLREAYVQRGDLVGRGQTIGVVGRYPPSAGAVHVHMELWLYGPALHAARRRELGGLAGTLDPMAHSAGCFDAGKRYPAERLVLTYPVEC